MSQESRCFSFVVLSIWLVVGSIEGADQRQNPKATVTSQVQTATNKQLNDTCGTTYDVALKIEQCAKPLMDVLEGTLEKWPSNEAETSDYCNQYAAAERCIREHGRKCTRGLQRTIISTLANSVQRARKRECVKTKLPVVLKATQCAEKHQKSIQAMTANITARFIVIEKQMPDPDMKTNSVCCMVNDIEKEIKSLLEPLCKEGSATIVRLYRACLEDVIELICRNPKCNDIFKGYKIPDMSKMPPVGIIAILLRIIFSLG